MNIIISWYCVRVRILIDVALLECAVALAIVMLLFALSTVVIIDILSDYASCCEYGYRFFHLFDTFAR